MKKLFLDENLYSISFPKIKVIDIPSIHLRKIKNSKICFLFQIFKQIQIYQEEHLPI